MTGAVPTTVILMAHGTYGDILPMVGLGRSLKARGHDVSILVNEHFSGAVAAAGLDFVALGSEDEYRCWLDRPSWHLWFGGLTGSRALVQGFPKQYALLQQLVASKSRPLLVGNSNCFQLLCLKEKTGLPAVVVHLSPKFFRSCGAAYRGAAYRGVCSGRSSASGLDPLRPDWLGDSRTAYRGVSSGRSSASGLDPLRPDWLGDSRTAYRRVSSGCSSALGLDSLRPDWLGSSCTTDHPDDWVTAPTGSRHSYPLLGRMWYYVLKAHQWLVDRLFVDPILGTALNRFRRGLQLPPAQNILDHTMHSGDLVLGLFPQWFASDPGDWPKHFRGCDFPLYDQESPSAELSIELKTFLKSGDPPVVFSGGSPFPHMQGFYRESAAACQLLGLRGILVSRHPQNLAFDLPEGVIAVPNVSFSLLFRHCKSVVHHGGIGTMSQAMRAGVPQLIQPIAWDQFDNAARCQELGIGLCLNVKNYQAANIATALTTLSQASFKERTKLLSERFDPDIDPFEKASQAIESLALRS